MSALNPFPRMTSTLIDHWPGGMPTRLDYVYQNDSDRTLCFFIRDALGEWLANPDLPPQVIGLPYEKVTILGGAVDAGDSKDVVTTLGIRRYGCAFNVENVGQHDPSHHLPMPEDSILNEARILDIDLVPIGVDPKILAGQALAEYNAKLSHLKENATLGTPVASRDKALLARRVFFEAEERDRVETLIAKAQKRYAEEGRSMAKFYSDELAQSRSWAENDNSPGHHG